MKKYKICRHPNLPSPLAMDESDNHIEVLCGAYLDKDEDDMSLVEVTIEEHPDDWLETLKEFEG